MGKRKWPSVKMERTSRRTSTKNRAKDWHKSWRKHKQAKLILA